MKLSSVLAAILVGAFLYALVMERDMLRALAGAEPIEAAAAEVTSAAAAETVSVIARHSTARPVESELTLRGQTEASRRVEVRAETTGLVISEPLRRGATVEAGDLLCELDAGTRPAQLAEAEARLKEAEANARASETLVERGFTSETTAIANRAALQAAQAAIDQAERELERLEITAPFGGLIETDTAELGELLQPGSECATIIDLSPIKLIGYAPERLVDRIEPGAPVGARLLTGQEFLGEVTFVSRSADPETRTFLVEAEVANRDNQIRDGITAEMVIGLDGTEAHLLPQSALTLDDLGRLGVRTVQDGVAAFVPVSIVRDTPEGIWLEGLPADVDVIVVGQDFVTDGQPVDARFMELEP